MQYNFLYFVMSTNAHPYHELKCQVGYTPLHHAAWKGHTECLSLLVAHGSVTDISSMKDSVSMTIVTCVYLFEWFQFVHIVEIDNTQK